MRRESALGDGGRLRRGAPFGREVRPRRLAAALVAGAAFAAVAVALPSAVDGLAERLPTADATTLSDRYLDGPRGPSCLRVVIGVDESGSMTDYAASRDAALDQVYAFARGNLRPDDELQVIDFAARAAERMAVTQIAAAGASTTVPAPVAVPDGRDTDLGPVLDVVAAAPRGRCDVALVLLSDAELADLPAGEADGTRLLVESRIHDAVLLVPDEHAAVPARWSDAFPAAAVSRFDGHDTDATAIAFGETVASLTRQDLASR